MRPWLSRPLLLLLLCLPSGRPMLQNKGVEMQVCSKPYGGRCFFSCQPGWKWVSHCYSFLSCCTELRRNKPAHFYDMVN